MPWDVREWVMFSSWLTVLFWEVRHWATLDSDRKNPFGNCDYSGYQWKWSVNTVEASRLSPFAGSRLIKPSICGRPVTTLTQMCLWSDPRSRDWLRSPLTTFISTIKSGRQSTGVRVMQSQRWRQHRVIIRPILNKQNNTKPFLEFFYNQFMHLSRITQRQLCVSSATTPLLTTPSVNFKCNNWTFYNTFQGIFFAFCGLIPTCKSKYMLSF